MPRHDGGSLENPLQGPPKERWWYEDEPEQGLTRMGCFGRKLHKQSCCGGGLFGGVHDDYRRRLPNYWKDITQGVTPKTLSSALFMFFATFFSTASLGAIIQKQTNHRVGLEEYLLMNSIAGMTHAVFGCQPLLVLRPTGPITAIMGKLSEYADQFEVDFYQYLGATGFFVGLYMIIIAGTDFCRMIKHLTRFTHDIFAFFVCSIYIVDGVTDVLKDCIDTGGSAQYNQAEFGRSLFSALLAVIVFTMSMWLNFAITWKSFGDMFRGLLTDYAVTISVFAVIIVSNVFPVEKSQVPRIEVPQSFAPTCLHDHTHHFNVSDSHGSNYDCICDSGTQHCSFTNAIKGGDHSSSSFGENNGTAAAREWLADYESMPIKVWIMAAVSGIPIVMFFYFDQNLSSLLTQQPYMHLRFGSFYHSSFLAMGIFNFIGPAFGLPFVTGSLPHSPQMVKSLTNYKRTPDDTFTVTGVSENRIAPCIMYLLIGLPVAAPHLLAQIPKGALNGVLTFVGVAGLLDCQLWERLQCVLRHPSAFHARYHGMDWRKVHLFTFLQLFFLATFWVANVKISFFLVPPLIVTTVFVRRWAIPSLFTEAELEQLDDDGTAIDDDDSSQDKPSHGLSGHRTTSEAVRTGGLFPSN